MDVENFELTVYGAFGFTLEEWNKAIDLIRTGKIDVESLVTHRLPLDRAETGFEMMANPPRDEIVLKTHILP
jgi:threonine dehydrogenase-like Zn-dependent dehydrogenase